MHDSETWTEQIGENAFIEHLKVPKVYGNWEYRYLTRSAPLEPILRRINPDVIEVGSPYFMPGIVRKIVRKHRLRARTYGFWHADFPVTYVKRFMEPMGQGMAKMGERMAWKYARKNYNQMDGVVVSSRLIMDRMERNGLKNVHFLPLGVNEQLFNPGRRDVGLIAELKKGNEDRLLLFFPHRFSKEKGLDVILKAYHMMCEGLDHEPVLIIAGAGPYEHLAKEASEKYEFVELKGFIEGKEEMARYYASADLGFALSKWETFGLSLLESLSSGLPLIAANEGAAYEHIDTSGAGIIIKEITPEAVARAVIEFSLMNAKKMREKARVYAEPLTWESCFENQLAIYRG